MSDEKSTTVVLQKPLTTEEIQFCSNYVNTGNQAESFRMVWPDAKNPHDGARRLLKRAEIKETINAAIQKINAKKADGIARAALLSIETAEDRLVEILTQRRRTIGEMLTRDTKELQMDGVSVKLVPNPSGKGKPIVQLEKSPEFEASLAEGAPIEDADLLKAIDITFKRKMAYPGKVAETPAAPTNVILYRPQWKVDSMPTAPQIEAHGE